MDVPWKFICVYNSEIIFPNAKLYFNIRHALYNFKFENYRNIFSIKIGKLISRYVNKIIYNSQVSKNHHEKMGYSKNNGQIIRNGFIQLKEKKKFIKLYHHGLLIRKLLLLEKLLGFIKLKHTRFFLKLVKLLAKNLTYL